MDSNAGREARAYTGGERARNFFDSWVQGFRGAYANAAGNIAELNKDSGTGADAVRQSIEQEISAMERQRQQAEKELENAQWLAKLGDTEAVKNATEKLSGIDNYINYLKNELGKAGQKIAEQTDEQILKPLYNYADRELSASGEKMNAAKYGTSRAGQFALDIGKTGLDMAADAALNIPMQGAGLASMAARVYGQTAAEARNEGDSAEKAAAKGLTSALIEIATEKLGGTNLSYGEGAFSKAIKNAGDKLAGSTAWRIVSDTLGEGFEEVLSDVLNTVAEHGFGWDDGTRTLGEALKDESGQMLYDFLLGSAVGALGTGANAVTGAYKRGGGAPTQETNAVNNAAPAVPATVDVSNLENTTVPAQNAAEAPQAAEALQATIEEQNNTASTQETESRYAIPYNEDSAANIRRETNKFKNIVAGLDTSVKDFFHKWAGGRKSHEGQKLEKLYLGEITDAARAKLSELLGYEVTSTDFIVTNDGVKHILDKHGDAKTEIKKGNLPLTDAVFDSLPDVVANPDTVDIGHEEKRGDRKSIIFKKNLPDGTAVYVQFDNTGRGTIEGKTLYLKPATTPGENAEISANTLTPETAGPVALGNTSEEVSDDISSDTSIPSGGENVNGNFTTAAGGKTARTSPVDTLLDVAGINTQPAPQNVSEAGNSSIQTAQSGENVNVDYTAAANEAFNAATAQQERLDNIAGEISAALGVPYYPGKQKSVSSIISRLTRNEARGKGNDWHTLKDLARTHIEMNSWEDIPKVLSMLDEMKIPYTASAKSTDFGYKGFHIVWYENGVGHELQLSTPEAWAVKQKSEEIYAKWRDATAEPDFVPTAEFDKDVAESIAMFNQLNLPDFSSFATSSGVSNRASSSKSSPNNIGERSEPQPPSANSENGLPGSYLITRPESVNVTPTDNPSNSNNVMSSMDIIQNLPQTVNGNFTTAEGGERYRSNLGAGKGKTRRSQTVETIEEADITTDERREQSNPYVKNGRFDYMPDTNSTQVERAEAVIQKDGWAKAVADFRADVARGKSDADLVALGAVLLNNAGNNNASGAEYMDIYTDYIELTHRTAGALQAAKIVQQLTPEGRLYAMQRVVDRLNEEYKASKLYLSALKHCRRRSRKKRLPSLMPLFGIPKSKLYMYLSLRHMYLSLRLSQASFWAYCQAVLPLTRTFSPQCTSG